MQVPMDILVKKLLLGQLQLLSTVFVNLEVLTVNQRMADVDFCG